jgi:hypothetical protein
VGLVLAGELVEGCLADVDDHLDDLAGEHKRRFVEVRNGRAGVTADVEGFSRVRNAVWSCCSNEFCRRASRSTTLSEPGPLPGTSIAVGQARADVATIGILARAWMPTAAVSRSSSTT